MDDWELETWSFKWGMAAGILVCLLIVLLV